MKRNDRPRVEFSPPMSVKMSRTRPVGNASRAGVLLWKLDRVPVVFGPLMIGRLRPFRHNNTAIRFGRYQTLRSRELYDLSIWITRHLESNRNQLTIPFLTGGVVPTVFARHESPGRSPIG